MKLFCVFTRNICLENWVEKTDYLLVKHIYMIRLLHNLIQVWKLACHGKYTIVIKSFWLVHSLEMDHNKTHQKISKYDSVFSDILCEYLCRTYCWWHGLGGGPKATRLHSLSLLCFMMTGVRRSCDLETIPDPGSVLMNTLLGVIWVYFTPIAYLLCVLEFLKYLKYERYLRTRMGNMEKILL